MRYSPYQTAVVDEHNNIVAYCHSEEQAAALAEELNEQESEYRD